MPRTNWLQAYETSMSTGIARRSRRPICHAARGRRMGGRCRRSLRRPGTGRGCWCLCMLSRWLLLVLLMASNGGRSSAGRRREWCTVRNARHCERALSRSSLRHVRLTMLLIIHLRRTFALHVRKTLIISTRWDSGRHHIGHGSTLHHIGHLRAVHVG